MIMRDDRNIDSWHVLYSVMAGTIKCADYSGQRTRKATEYRIDRYIDPRMFDQYRRVAKPDDHGLIIR